MDIDIWQFLHLYPESRSFTISPVLCNPGQYNPGLAGCRGARGMVAVTSGGDVVPCLQVSGVMMQQGIHLGNLHTQRLQDLLESGPYLETVCDTVGSIRESNQKCAGCEWFEYCTGGCRAMGLLFLGEQRDFRGEDLSKCGFFEHGWYEKTSAALSEWKNLSSIPGKVPASGKIADAADIPEENAK